MSLYTQYETDNEKEVNGIPVEFGSNEDGSVPTIVISRIGESNKEYTKALRIATKPFQRQIEMKTLSAEKDNEIYRNVFASAVIKGWSNIFDRAGNPLPFTTENVRTSVIGIFAGCCDSSANFNQITNVAGYLRIVASHKSKIGVELVSLWNINSKFIRNGTD